MFRQVEPEYEGSCPNMERTIVWRESCLSLLCSRHLSHFKKSVHLRCVLRCEDCFGLEAEAKIFLVMEKELVSTFCVFIVQSQCNTTIRSKFPQLKASRE